MLTQLPNTIDDVFDVTFSPSYNQLNEIKAWLIEEEGKSDDGFYCRWQDITSSFDKNELAIISSKKNAIGFVTWRISTEKTAHIGIMEVRPGFRRRGVGRHLTNELLCFLKGQGIYVVELQCSPSSSENAWKCLGFLEFPTAPNHNFNIGANKRLYTIIIEHLPVNLSPLSKETIELWDDEPRMIKNNTVCKYLWNVEVMPSTRKLIKPIIHPASYKWRLRWKVNGTIQSDSLIKLFGTQQIDFDSFLIIDELPIN